MDRARNSHQDGRSAGTILCLDFHAGEEKYRRELAGVRRFAKQHGFRVATMERFEPETLPELLARVRVAGCIVECSARFDIRSLPPRLFGKTPVVYLDPPQRLPWRSVASVVCDNAAVARMAFRELSAGLPPAFAVIGYRAPCQWSRNRVTAFRACCKEAGVPCATFPARGGETLEARTERLKEWLAALPPHCAVFAVNDTTARETRRAFHAIGRVLPQTATLVGTDALDAAQNPEHDLGITSIRIDFEHAGYLAARLLAAAMAGPAVATFGPLLVERRISTRGRGRREPYILEAVETIRAKACDGLTAAKLASRFRGSRHLFEMRFREAMGHSVLEEILQVRLERVLELLARRDVPIGAIATFCGFRTDGELRKLFLSRFHVSMREWRRTRL
jgi:LacI family transcriptional regulator